MKIHNEVDYVLLIHGNLDQEVLPKNQYDISYNASKDVISIDDKLSENTYRINRVGLVSEVKDLGTSVSLTGLTNTTLFAILKEYFYSNPTQVVNKYASEAQPATAYEMTFDKDKVLADLTLTEATTFTLASAGNVPYKTVTFLMVADGVQAYDASTDFLKVGGSLIGEGVPAAGTYRVTMFFNGTEVEVSDELVATV